MTPEQVQIELERHAHGLASCVQAREALHRDQMREDRTVRALTALGLITAALAFAVIILAVTL